MTFRVVLAPAVESDLVRLAEFLAEHDPGAAYRAGEAIKTGLRSLEFMPMRGLRFEDGRRQLTIRFGQSGYAIQYRVKGRTVVVARVFHMRERRG